MREYFKKLLFIYRFNKIERLFNAATVLAFEYARAWYKYAPKLIEEQVRVHDDMRDIRSTATDQIVSYLFGRDYVNQKGIVDRNFKERLTTTRAYVPVWADEIMNRDILFRRLVVYSLICAEKFAEIELKHPRRFSDNVDIGSRDRRMQMIKKYADENQHVYMDFKDYEKLIEKFARWSDKYSTLSQSNKLALVEKNNLFLKADK